jgi:uncharacterized membrane protein
MSSGEFVYSESAEITCEPIGEPNLAPSMYAAGYRPAAGEVNVSMDERLATGLAGGALALFGLTRGSLKGVALALLGGGLAYRALSGHCPMYQALGWRRDQAGSNRAGVKARAGERVVRSIIINKEPEDLFRFWRNLANIPQVMDHVLEVQVVDGKRSHWKAKGPLNTTLSWDAEIINERPDELIAWQSINSNEVATAGSVHFEPATEGGTLLTVSLKYDPPGGKAVTTLARFLRQGLEARLEEDLHHFKQMMESGARPVPRPQATGL